MYDQRSYNEMRGGQLYCMECGTQIISDSNLVNELVFDSASKPGGRFVFDGVI